METSKKCMIEARKIDDPSCRSEFAVVCLMPPSYINANASNEEYLIKCKELYENCIKNASECKKKACNFILKTCEEQEAHTK